MILAVILFMATPDNAYLEAMRAKAKAIGGQLMRVGDTPSMLGSGINNKYIAVIAQPDYDVGDLMVFKRANGGLTIHPITHKKPNKKKAGQMYPLGSDDSPMEMPPGFMYYTKGTNNRVGDGWMDRGAMVGKTVVLDPGKSASTTKAKEKTLMVVGK